MTGYIPLGRRGRCFALCALLALTFAGGVACAQEAATATPPNIIVILADDLGFGDLGAYGQKKIRTPRLDKMAQEGIRFTDFYAGNTVCAPSRVALLTGMNMAHAHTRSNRGPGLREEDVVIAEVLKQADYATGVFGKWGFGSTEKGAPDRQGFDEFLGYLGHVHAHSYFTDHLYAIRDGHTERVDVDSDCTKKAYWEQFAGRLGVGGRLVAAVRGVR